MKKYRNKIYCMECGKKLGIEKEAIGYNEKTGEKIFDVYKSCLNKECPNEGRYYLGNTSNLSTGFFAWLSKLWQSIRKLYKFFF